MTSKLGSFLKRLTDDEVVRKLLSGGFWSLAIKIGSAGLTYLMFVLLARSMTIDDYGRYSFGFNLATFLSVVAGFGLHVAIMRWWPEYLAKNDTATSVAAYHWSSKTTLAGILAISSIMVVVTIGISEIQGGNPWYLLFAAALIGPLCYSEFIASLMRAQGSVGWALVPRDIIWRGIVCISAAIIVWQGKLVTAGQAMLLTAVALGVLVLAQVGVVNRRTPEIKAYPRSVAPDHHQAWRRTAIVLWAASILYALIQYVDVVLVGLLISPEAAGPYFAVTKTASLVSLLLVASNMISAPMISRHWHADESVKLQNLLRIVAIGVGIPTIIGFVFIVAFGRSLLGLFGGGFESAYPSLLVLAFGYTINALSGPMSYIFQFTGFEAVYLKIMWTSYLGALLLQILLIPSLGIMGAAIGTTAGLVIWNIRALIVARRDIGIDPSFLSILKYRWK